MQEAKFYSFLNNFYFPLPYIAPPTMVYGIYPGNKKWEGIGYDYSAQGFNSSFEIYWFCFLKKKLLGMPFEVQGAGGI